MRELLRSVTKVRMKEMGYSRPNKRMSGGRWRQIVNAYPTSRTTGLKMSKNFHGKKRYKPDHSNPVFVY